MEQFNDKYEMNYKKLRTELDLELKNECFSRVRELEIKINEITAEYRDKGLNIGFVSGVCYRAGDTIESNLNVSASNAHLMSHIDAIAKNQKELIPMLMMEWMVKGDLFKED